MRKYTFLFILVCFGLKISSTQSMDSETPLKKEVCWDNFTIQNSALSGTFKEGILKIYDGEELFNEYDTNQPRYYDLYVEEMEKSRGRVYNIPKRKWKITNILFDKTNTVYILGGALCCQDRPLLKMTKETVTELFTDSIVWKIYTNDGENVIAHKTPFAGSIDNSADVQLNTLNS